MSFAFSVLRFRSGGRRESEKCLLTTTALLLTHHFRICWNWEDFCIDPQQSVHCPLSFGYHIPLDLGHHDAELEKVRSLAIFLGPRDLTALCSIAPVLLQLPPLLYIALGPCFYLWELLGTSWTVHFYFTLQILFLTIPRTKYDIYCIVATACFISCLAPSFCLVSLRQATILARTWAKGVQKISATARTELKLF